MATNLINTVEMRKAITEQLGLTVSLPTAITWIRRYQLGKKIGGRWYIQQQSLNEFIQGIKSIKEGRSGNKKKKAT